MENNTHNRVFSIDKVADEITAGSDELTDWMQNNGNHLFLKTDTITSAQFGKVSAWATNQKYESTAIHTFLQVADFYLVAHVIMWWLPMRSLLILLKELKFPTLVLVLVCVL